MYIWGYWPEFSEDCALRSSTSHFCTVQCFFIAMITPLMFQGWDTHLLNDFIQCCCKGKRFNQTKEVCCCVYTQPQPHMFASLKNKDHAVLVHLFSEAGVVSKRTNCPTLTY